jgi:hypothetical protein
MFIDIEKRDRYPPVFYIVFARDCSENTFYHAALINEKKIANRKPDLWARPKVKNKYIKKKVSTFGAFIR